MSEADEKTMLDVLKKLVDNMSHTLKEAEACSEKMLPIWFLLMHFEAAEIQMAFEIIKAMQEAQIAGLRAKQNEVQNDHQRCNCGN